MCTAPVMTSFGDGTWTVRNTLLSGVSSTPLLAERRCFSRNSLSGSLRMSANRTSRCAPLSWLVTTMTARRAVRSSFSVLRMSRRKGLLHLLDEHLDLAAAGQPDLPGGLVGDAELQGPRLAALDHVDGFGHHRALDAAARHRAQKVALVVDHQIRADRPGRRAPGLDHGRDPDAAPGLLP